MWWKRIRTTITGFDKKYVKSEKRVIKEQLLKDAAEGMKEDQKYVIEIKTLVSYNHYKEECTIEASIEIDDVEEPAKQMENRGKGFPLADGGYYDS